MIKNYLIFFRCLPWCLLVFWLPGWTNAQVLSSYEVPRTVPLRQAMEEGVVDGFIAGSSDRQTFLEVLDADGQHYGKCMALWVENRLDSAIILQLDGGTLLVPDDSSVQVMVVTHDLALALEPCEAVAVRFYAMCSEIHKKAPWYGTLFRVGDRADRKLQKLVRFLEIHDHQDMVGQHAVWAHTDRVGVEELKAYGADNRSLHRTRAILRSVGLSTPLETEMVSPEDGRTDSLFAAMADADPLSPSVPVVPKSVDLARSSNQDTITMSRAVAYGGMALIGALALSTLLLAFKRKKGTRPDSEQPVA